MRNALHMQAYIHMKIAGLPLNQSGRSRQNQATALAAGYKGRIRPARVPPKQHRDRLSSQLRSALSLRWLRCCCILHVLPRGDVERPP